MERSQALLMVKSILETPHSYLSSSSDSSDDELLYYAHTSLSSACINADLLVHDDTLVDADNPNKVLEYVENIVHNYTDEEFKQIFRIDRSTATFFIDLLQKSKILPTYFGGRKKIDAESYVLITFSYMGSKEPLRYIAKRFGVSLHSVWNVVHRTINWICDMEAEYIRWPMDESDINDITTEFEQIHGIQNVIGALIGTHIKMASSKYLDESFINCQNYNSMILQVVVTPDLRFTNVYCEEPGSQTYSRVLYNSPLYEHVDQLIPGGMYLLGDGAYPSLSWLVPPVKEIGNLRNREIEFNKLHSETYVAAENALMILKARFRRLLFFSTHNTIHFSKLVLAACVVHNLCIERNDIGFVMEYEDEYSIREIEIEDGESVNDRRVQLIKDMKNWKK